MKRTTDAEAQYDLALRLEQHWQGYLSRCVVRRDRGELEKALGDCEVAHKGIVNEDTVYFLGWLYAKLGRQADAMRVLEPAVGSTIKSRRIFEVLADTYDAVGRTADAARLRADADKDFAKGSDL